MDYKELIAKAKEIDEQATPGPWMWDLISSAPRGRENDDIQEI